MTDNTALLAKQYHGSAVYSMRRYLLRISKQSLKKSFAETGMIIMIIMMIMIVMIIMAIMIIIITTAELACGNSKKIGEKWGWSCFAAVSPVKKPSYLNEPVSEPWDPFAKSVFAKEP